ncbi:Type I phosphodiesterase / nucleotide pyrophosphatase [Polystyrenella longa]|uniref:Type I phosphodiesterase / nucleotide pyrophosphatase n=1 Tax=Polystyrenella longa TaxID=2528007 RepID=A0A518CJ45_9PLAN|nr:nucleotide pyrophosphatase/phosphodiesterase family protein [Polystyrenella longa]QDU79248.1 Type I phosphodiesterase / nucleotide pyrophosphatase [Polystyrenella longa]
MTKPLVVLNIVGLTYDMIGDRTPNLKGLAEDGFARPMGTILPAVTCSAQSTMLTGLMPREHGIVGNGWYFRDTSEIRFWLQSNHLVKGERVYEAAKQRDPNYTTAKMFWWYNMYAPVEHSVTPRPSYPADGRKVFDSYSQPADLKDKLQEKLGVFPLFKFWGPTANIESSRWIADASIEVMQEQNPSLTLVYLPHLDYNLQRLGVSDSRTDQDIRDIDVEAGKVIDAARKRSAEIMVVSEYAITDVSQPVHINRVLREAGYLQVRQEMLGWETLDAGASRAFAVADHQLAHVYVQRAEDLKEVAQLLEKTAGVERVLDRQAQAEFGIDHPHAGDLVVLAAPQAWFTYYFWLDDNVAPDYARTVDIHRKPGYDPVELFVDPEIRLPMLKMARRLARKKLGFRYYMDMIGLDAGLVKGSHGRLPSAGKEESEGPVLISSSRKIERDQIPMTAVKEMMLQLQFD